MKTPIAIFLGLALIAGAIFFRPEVIPEAKARSDCATFGFLDYRHKKVMEELEYIQGQNRDANNGIRKLAFKISQLPK